MPFTPPCYVCNQLRAWNDVEERWECHSDECFVLAEAQRLDRKNGIKSVYFAPVVGGGGPHSNRRAWEQKFNRDMDSYREARRAGEQPETVSVEGVRKARQKQDTLERALAKKSVVDFG